MCVVEMAGWNNGNFVSANTYQFLKRQDFPQLRSHISGLLQLKLQSQIFRDTLRRFVTLKIGKIGLSWQRIR